MKTPMHISRSNGTNNVESGRPRPRARRGDVAGLVALIAGLLLAARPAAAGSIFVIAMENHNFTQPDPTSSPQQILGNPAAPFINSLITPGNSNAVQVSYATAYFNAGKGVHPSEPNYVWAEAGTDFGVHTDADPGTNHGNIFDAAHLTAQLNAAGISWRNYQEDVEFSASPTNSASGTSTNFVNPYYGTGQYNYAVKHNPMAFFTDTAVQNVHPLAQLFADLAGGAVARYNWITPNQYNDAHSSLSGGFTYQGVHYTGDQSSIAQGDNFLATVIPQIMASDAYQDNGAIIIWWDESEDGDGADRTIPEIVISPLARGNAYASAVPLNHSSDIKTMEEIFRLPLLNNPIPVAETNVDGAFNHVALVNDLSDLFVAGAIPAPPVLTVTRGRFIHHPGTHRVSEFVHIRNEGKTPVPAPLWLVLDNLSAGATLVNSDGTTSVLAPLGSPFVKVSIGDRDHGADGDAPDRERDDFLRPHEARTVKLEFLDKGDVAISYDTRLLNVTPAP